MMKLDKDTVDQMQTAMDNVALRMFQDELRNSMVYGPPFLSKLLGEFLKIREQSKDQPVVNTTTFKLTDDQVEAIVIEEMKFCYSYALETGDWEQKDAAEYMLRRYMYKPEFDKLMEKLNKPKQPRKAKKE